MAKKAAVEEVADASGIVEIELSRPVVFEDVTYEKVVLDLAGLTGKDMAEISREWTRTGNFSTVAGLDSIYCTMVACRAAGLPNEFADVLSARDYNYLHMAVQTFLTH